MLSSYIHLQTYKASTSSFFWRVQLFGFLNVKTEMVVILTPVIGELFLRFQTKEVEAPMNLWTIRVTWRQSGRISFLQKILHGLMECPLRRICRNSTYFRCGCDDLQYQDTLNTFGHSYILHCQSTTLDPKRNTKSKSRLLRIPEWQMVSSTVKLFETCRCWYVLPCSFEYEYGNDIVNLADGKVQYLMFSSKMTSPKVPIVAGKDSGADLSSCGGGTKCRMFGYAVNTKQRDL